MAGNKVATAADRRRSVTDEYGTYVAVTPVDIGGVRAFNVGDPVPKSHVDSGVVPQESVAKASTKAGHAAVEGLNQP